MPQGAQRSWSGCIGARMPPYFRWAVLSVPTGSDPGTGRARRGTCRPCSSILRWPGRRFMRTIRLRTIALACSCLFAAPLSSFAQTNGGPAAASVEGDASVASGDLAAPSPRSAVTPLEMAALPSSESGAGTEPSFLEDQAPSPPDQAQAQGQGQGQAAPPAGNPAPPSLGDLGFGSEQTQGSAQDQALLDKRSHMLKIHQRLGLITTVPLVATIFSGGLAGGRSTSSGGRDLHAGLGALSAALYLTTAYYAIYAPKLPGTTV